MSESRDELLNRAKASTSVDHAELEGMTIEELRTLLERAQVDIDRRAEREDNYRRKSRLKNFKEKFPPGTIFRVIGEFPLDSCQPQGSMGVIQKYQRNTQGPSVRWFSTGTCYVLGAIHCVEKVSATTSESLEFAKNGLSSLCCLQKTISDLADKSGIAQATLAKARFEQIRDLERFIVGERKLHELMEKTFPNGSVVSLLNEAGKRVFGRVIHRSIKRRALTVKFGYNSQERYVLYSDPMDLISHLASPYRTGQRVQQIFGRLNDKGFAFGVITALEENERGVRIKIHWDGSDKPSGRLFDPALFRACADGEEPFQDEDLPTIREMDLLNARKARINSIIE